MKTLVDSGRRAVLQVEMILESEADILQSMGGWKISSVPPTVRNIFHPGMELGGDT